MMCTGGTTGRPKGVLWRQSDMYVLSMVGADHESVTEIHDKVRAGGPPWFAVSPLMHAAGMWTAFAALCAGLPVVLYDDSNKLDVRSVWQTAEREKVGMMTMVGDAYAGPLIAELRAHPYDLSSLNSIGTGGAATNPKYQTGTDGMLPHDHASSKATARRKPETWRFGHSPAANGEPTPFTLRRVRRDGPLEPTTAGSLRPGEQEIGWVGQGPAGSHSDTSMMPRPPSETFPEVEGQRVVIPGDRPVLRRRRHHPAVRA